MSNELPDGFSSLVDLADDMIDGLHDHEARLKIKQWTEASLTPLLLEARARKRAYGDAQAAEDTVTGQRKVANSNAKAFIATAKRLLTGALGAAASRPWEEAGWPTGTTEAPETIDGRRKLLEKLAPWLGSHPEHDVANQNFTGARATEIFNALDGALSELKSKVAARVSAASADDASEKALRNGMSGLAEELGRLIPSDSADWYYFGLVPPAKAEPPAQPEDLAVHQAGPSTVVAGCDRSPRGLRYVFLLQVSGRDAAPAAQEPRRDPQITLEGLPTTSTVRVSVYVTNAAGKSPTTGPVQMKLS